MKDTPRKDKEVCLNKTSTLSSENAESLSSSPSDNDFSTNDIQVSMVWLMITR